jgi:hypothetical protein
MATRKQTGRPNGPHDQILILDRITLPDGRVQLVMERSRIRLKGKPREGAAAPIGI